MSEKMYEELICINISCLLITGQQPADADAGGHREVAL